MKKIYAFATLCLLTLAGSCNKFLDVVPNDGIATLDMAFNLRSTAERYLGTCYSYMPIEGNVIHDPAMLTGDELWDLVGRIVMEAVKETGSPELLPFLLAKPLEGDGDA